MKDSIAIGQYLRLHHGLKLENLQRMIRNQNLLELVKEEEFEPGEYISATSFVDDNSLFGQYLVNITYLGYDKKIFYFIDVDGYLIKSDYALTTINSELTIVLTSTSVHSFEDAENVLPFTLATNITRLIRSNIFAKQLAYA